MPVTIVDPTSTEAEHLASVDVKFSGLHIGGGIYFSANHQPSEGGTSTAVPQASLDTEAEAHRTDEIDFTLPDDSAEWDDYLVDADSDGTPETVLEGFDISLHVGRTLDDGSLYDGFAVPLLIALDSGDLMGLTGTVTGYPSAANALDGQDGTLHETTGTISGYTSQSVAGDPAGYFTVTDAEILGGMSGGGLYVDYDADGDGTAETYAVGTVARAGYVDYPDPQEDDYYARVADLAPQYADLAAAIEGLTGDDARTADDFARMVILTGQSAGASETVFDGTFFHEDILGSVNADSLSGAGGDDLLEGAEGADTLSGGTGADTLDGGTGSDHLSGGADTDILRGGADADTLEGGDGNDSLTGGDGDDSLSGDAGADTLMGGTGADRLLGGADADLLMGGEGTDILDGGEDDDTLSGQDGDDTLTGQAGSDLLDGGAGADRLSGGTGDDSLIGGTGADTLDGGEGNDRLDGGAEADRLEGGAGDDRLSGGADRDSLHGGDGADTLDGGAEDDALDGGTGDDSLLGADGNDYLRGGDGHDSLSGGDGLDVLDGGAGNDLLAGGAEGDTLTGAEGDDTLEGDAGADVLHGGEGADSLSGGAGQDNLSGEDGADLLLGGADADTLSGGDGDDTLDGGAGADVMTGGAGIDTFHVLAETGASDRLTDFEAAEDILDLSRYFDSVEAVRAAAVVEGANLRIDLSAGALPEAAGAGTLYLMQMDLSDLAAATVVVSCFTPGTQIATLAGPRAVDSLSAGDLVMTRDHGAQRVVTVLRRHLGPDELAARPDLAPVRIAAGSLGPGLPRRDLRVSPQHRMLVSGALARRFGSAPEVLVAATKLCALPGIAPDPAPQGVTYLHVVMARHEVLTAEGCATESFWPGPAALAGLPPAQADEMRALFGRCPLPARPLVEAGAARRLVARHLSRGTPIQQPDRPPRTRALASRSALPRLN